MKLLWFACVLLSAYVRGDFDASQQIQDVQDVNFDLGSNLLSVNLLASEHEVSADDDLLIQELSAFEGRNLIADFINNALEGFRPVVINGNDGLPPLDPFIIDTIGPYNYMVTGVRLTGQVNNFRVEGLRWYIVDRVTFNALRLALGIHLTVPWLTFDGTYDARASVLLISHRANGNYRVFLNRLELGVDVRLGTNIAGGGHLILRELNIKINIHDTLIQITGMTGSNLINNLISSSVQSITQDVIQSELENVSKMLSEELFDIINEVLKEFTLSDILG